MAGCFPMDCWPWPRMNSLPSWSPNHGVYATISYASEDGQTQNAGERRKFVANGRYENHSLEKDGFALPGDDLKVIAKHFWMGIDLQKTEGHDLYDYLETSRVLYPLAEKVLQEAFPSARKILVFDHIARHNARYEMEKEQGEVTKMLASSYAFSVHGDYTVRSGFTRLESLMKAYEDPERIEEVLKQRFAFVNVWVPLQRVERDPLGMIEWNTQRPQDVVTIKLIYPHRTAEVYRVVPSDLHRWVYYPDMMPGECLVFKVFDSATDGRARFSLHAAFQDPTSKPDAPSRESIEMRCVVFFDALPEGFGDSFVAPHLLPGTNCIMNPERMPVSAPGNEW